LQPDSRQTPSTYNQISSENEFFKGDYFFELRQFFSRRSKSLSESERIDSGTYLKAVCK